MNTPRVLLSIAAPCLMLALVVAAAHGGRWRIPGLGVLYAEPFAEWLVAGLVLAALFLVCGAVSVALLGGVL